MKNLYLIPTDKPSRLRYWCGDLELNSLELAKKLDEGVEFQNIHITNDEGIKEGDYCLSKLNEIVKFHSGYDYRYYAKIILTSDQDLIKDGVQAIDDEFLKWFVKNPSCEWVDLDTFSMGNKVLYNVVFPQEEPKMIECYFIPRHNTSSATICGNCGKEKFLHTIGLGIKVYKSVVITQEEPKQETERGLIIKKSDGSIIKQETLEEAMERLLKEMKKIPMTFVPDERMYSEEDLKEAFNVARHIGKENIAYEFDEWFNKHKKK